MDSKIGFEMNLIVVEAIRGRCASFTVLTATVSEIFGGQTPPWIYFSSIDVFLVIYSATIMLYTDTFYLFIFYYFF